MPNTESDIEFLTDFLSVAAPCALSSGCSGVNVWTGSVWTSAALLRLVIYGIEAQQLSYKLSHSTRQYNLLIQFFKLNTACE